MAETVKLASVRILSDALAFLKKAFSAAGSQIDRSTSGGGKEQLIVRTRRGHLELRFPGVILGTMGIPLTYDQEKEFQRTKVPPVRRTWPVTDVVIELPCEGSWSQSATFDRIDDLASLVGALGKDGPVELTLNSSMALSSGSRRVLAKQAPHAHGVHVSDLPLVPMVSAASTEADMMLDAATVGDMVETILPMVSTDATRPGLHSALFEMETDKWTAVATDGHRAVSAETLLRADAKREVLIRRQDLQMIVDLCRMKGDEQVRWRVGKCQKGFGFCWISRTGPDGETITLACLIVEAQFPAWRQIMPADANRATTVLTFSPADFVKRARAFQTLAFAADAFAFGRTGGLLIEDSGSPDGVIFKTGDKTVQVIASALVAGAPPQIGLNSSYLIQPLIDVQDTRATLRIFGELDPMVLVVKPTPYVLARHVIMPMRMDGKDRGWTPTAETPPPRSALREPGKRDKTRHTAALRTSLASATLPTPPSIGTVQAPMLKRVADSLRAAGKTLHLWIGPGELRVYSERFRGQQGSCVVSLPMKEGPDTGAWRGSIGRENLAGLAEAFGEESINLSAVNEGPDKGKLLMFTATEKAMVQTNVHPDSAGMFERVQATPTFVHGQVLHAETIGHMAKAVIPFVETDDVHTRRTGAMLRVTDHQTTLAGTDGHRAAVLSTPSGGPDLVGAIHRDNLKVLSVVLRSKSPPTELRVANSKGMFEGADELTGVGLVTGTGERYAFWSSVLDWPAIDQVLDLASLDPAKVSSAQVPTEDLRKELAVMLKLKATTEVQVVQLLMLRGSLKVRLSGSAKAAVEKTFPATVKGKETASAVNARYLLDMLAPIESEQALIIMEHRGASEDGKPIYNPIHLLGRVSPYISMNSVTMPIGDETLQVQEPSTFGEPTLAPLSPVRPYSGAARKSPPPKARPARPASRKQVFIDHGAALMVLTGLEGKAWEQGQRKDAATLRDPFGFFANLAAFRALEETRKEGVEGAEDLIISDVIPDAGTISGEHGRVYSVLDDGEVVLLGETADRSFSARASKVLTVMG